MREKKTKKGFFPGKTGRAVLLLSVCLILISSLLSGTLSGCRRKGKKAGGSRSELTVFNYGEYIDVETLKMFEKETGIHVNYEEYVTPEDMYTKYKSGVIDYDLICSTDYMVEKLSREGELLKFDASRMKYLDNIDSRYMELCNSFDPGNQFAIPYFFGTVGILYNTEIVRDKVDSWSILWNKKYKNQIIMENSMRDAFLVPLKWKGYSLNTTDEKELRECQQLLIRQKPLVEAYLVDETRDAMIAGDAALAVTYSGDATEAMDSNENLDYVVPKEGSNIWFDCWFIPRTCRHKKEAELFMDFMNREDVAAMNFDFIYYGTPNRAVYDSLDEEIRQDRTIFPDQTILDKCEVYSYLGRETDRLYSRMWKELKSY